MNSGATLWIVATPIGNLDDIAPRAVAVLNGVAAIACEDTRHSRVLMTRIGVTTPLLAYHEHNERELAPKLVERLAGGESLALVSDAGTPLINDPGFRLVRAARERGIAVSTVPGPCAAIAALSISGLPCEAFVFEGFLPSKAAARRERLSALATEPRTLVFYEAKHRILDTLADMIQAFGGARQAALARELTKAHETVLVGSLSGLSERVGADPDQQRGEFVLLVSGADEDATGARQREGERVYELLARELPPGRAASLAAAITGAARNMLYRRDS
jgi:16S rRNA (cytidine1402-2'-O)-methyltransferase